jgi:hypothetical protein
MWAIPAHGGLVGCACGDCARFRLLRCGLRLPLAGMIAKRIRSAEKRSACGFGCFCGCADCAEKRSKAACGCFGCYMVRFCASAASAACWCASAASLRYHHGCFRVLLRRDWRALRLRLRLRLRVRQSPASQSKRFADWRALRVLRVRSRKRPVSRSAGRLAWDNAPPRSMSAAKRASPWKNMRNSG